VLTAASDMGSPFVVTLMKTILYQKFSVCNNQIYA